MYLKKPKFWDNKISILPYFLLPFTIFIIFANFLRAQKKKILPRKLKTICIGNIYVGGTGKTPTTIKLFKLIKKINNVATAKKHYLNQIDEEILLRKKTKLITAENRLKILYKAINKKVDVVIFDDGLQDGQIDYNLKIVCFNSINGVGNGFLIPAGPLRENLENLKKYDAALILCDNHSPKALKRLLMRYNSKLKIFTSNYEPANLIDVNKNKKYFIFSGIGNPKSFEKILKKNKLEIVDQVVFPDHYTYSDKDYINIINKAKKYNAKILTTEKDYVKIPSRYKKNIKFLKLDLIIHNEKKFIKFIKLKIR